MLQKLVSLPPVALGLKLLAAYHRVAIARSAAALAYFLILTLFPLLVCVNGFIGLFRLDLQAMLDTLTQLLPAQVLLLLEDYLLALPARQSNALVTASLVTLLLSASAGLRTLFHTMDQLYGTQPRHPFLRTLSSLFLSLLFLLTIYLSVVVIFTGDWFFGLLQTHLPHTLTSLIPLEPLGQLWRWMRYLLLFCFMLLLVLLLYRTGTPRQCRSPKTLLTASCAAALAIVVCSAAFSWLISLSTRYTLIYGSLASLIVLLVWLYFCGNILLLGAALGQLQAPSPDT